MQQHVACLPPPLILIAVKVNLFSQKRHILQKLNATKHLKEKLEKNSITKFSIFE
jgi:hypothetical protein